MGRIAIGLGAAVAVAAVGAGTFAYVQLSGGGTQPHDVLPADSVGYLRLDLDPGASQKIDLFRLARRVPDLAEDLGIEEDTDLRELVVDELGDCVDHEKDVEPWLGERIGVAFGPEASEEAIRIAVQVDDEDAARKGIDALFACGDEAHGIAFLDGYAVVTPSQKSADAAVRAAEEKPLSDDEDFAADMDALGEQGLLSGWVDVEGVAKLAAEADPRNELGLSEAAEQATSAAISLRAGSDSLELAGVGRVDEDVETPTVRPLGDLPGDTAVAVSLVGGGEGVAEGWEQALSDIDELLGSGLLGLGGPDPFDEDALDADPETSGPDVEEVVTDIEQTLDVTLPEDLTTLLGDALTLWVGTEGLSDLPRSSGPDALSRVAAGLRMESDPEDATDLATRLAASLGALSGLDLVAEGTDDGAVLALNDAAATALASDGDLASNEGYRAVIDDEGDFAGGMFVDVSAIIAALREAGPPPDVEEILADASVVEAIGVTSSRRDDDVLDLSVKVAFRERD